MERTPQTLLEVITLFSDEKRAFDYFRNRRWANGVTCPRCQSAKVHLIESRMIWRCNGCRKQFSVKVGTIFEDSPIKLGKWLPAMWMIANDKNGISSYELHRGLGVTQKTAWFMLHRIRLAMQNGTFEKLKNDVEIDETLLGGKEQNKHQNKRIKGATGHLGKTIVWGAIEREGLVVTKILPDTQKRTMQSAVFQHVELGSNLYSDSHGAYRSLKHSFEHSFVDHATAYVQGQTHTNSLENFWSLLKRSIKGTYVSVEPFHLSRYLDEQTFRYNLRKENDATRFERVLSQVVSRRLTFSELTGKAENPL